MPKKSTLNNRKDYKTPKKNTPKVFSKITEKNLDKIFNLNDIFIDTKTQRIKGQ